MRAAPLRGMNPRRYALPPLALLEAFEAAARHLSFTRAADELALTQSAVSRQIQALEAHLGVALFRRLHRALQLTEDGQALERTVTEVLGQLQRTAEQLRRADRMKTVVVTTTPGFAGLWLIPRISGFSAARPDVDVRISAGNALANLSRDGVDIAVRYQPVDAAGPTGPRLFGEVVFPVCSPRLLRDAARPLAEPDDLRRHALLFMEPDGGNQLQDWPMWLHAMKLQDLKPASVLHFSSYDQLVHAAIDGQGVALGKSPLIDRLLEQRKLVAPFRREVASARGYCMLLADAATRKPEVADFAAWLLREAQASNTRGGAGTASLAPSKPAAGSDGKPIGRRAVRPRAPGPEGRARR